MYIHRDIEPILIKSLKSFPVVALTGPRQTGKSTLLRTLFRDGYQYISFDDPLVRDRAVDDPVLFISNLEGKVILDEIQYVPGLLPYLKMKVDEERRSKGRFILTGSQQFNLMKDISETLAGRIALFTLLPFSCSETRKIEGEKASPVRTGDFFVYASLNGLFPEICVNKEMDARLWYGSYLQTYLERDIRTLYNPGNLRDFTRFIKLLASRCSQVLNLSTYARDIGVSVNTIKSWLSVLEASQLIYILEPYYKNPGKRVTKSPKVYWNDLGLVCYLTGIYTGEHLFNGPMAGALFENLVIQETVKHFFNKGHRPNLYYMKVEGAFEIDLLMEREDSLLPFEIKLTKSPNPGMATGLNRFMEAFPGLDVRKGTIICLADSTHPLTKTVDATNLMSYINMLG